MKPSLIDTDILSLFFRNHPKVVANFTTYLNHYSYLNISIITYYEILSGLKYRDSHNKLTNFLEFIADHQVLPLTQESVSQSAEIYAKLRQQGTPIDDIDLLIAGVAMANNLVLVTHNTKHFQRVKELSIEDWSKDEV